MRLEPVRYTFVRWRGRHPVALKLISTFPSTYLARRLKDLNQSSEVMVGDGGPSVDHIGSRFCGGRGDSGRCDRLIAAARIGGPSP